MINRRTFGALLAGAVAAPRSAWSQSVTAKTVYYASVGPELTPLRRRRCRRGVAEARHGHAARQYPICLAASLEALSLRGVERAAGPASPATSTWPTRSAIDPASGALQPHGEPQTLPSRPIHTSVDATGEYLLTAYNDPSNVTVHRIKGDGTLGEAVSQPGKLDAGIYGHQVLTTPGNRTAILVARGNNAGRRQARGSGRAQGLRLQERRADEPRLGRARQRARLRAAPSRFSSDAAVGLCLDRAAEQALRLPAASGRHARPRPDLRQGHPGRPRQRQAGAGRRPDPRASERPLRLSHQPQPGRGRFRRQEDVQRRREQRRGVRDRPADRRAGADPDHRRPWHPPAQLRHRSEPDACWSPPASGRCRCATATRSSS